MSIRCHPQRQVGGFLTKPLTLQPDVQYILQSGSADAIPDALVFGVPFAVSF
jgi:carbohydrate-selective porin OprB